MARKKFFARIWDAIRRIFNGLKREIKEIVPVAISVVQQVKTVIDSPVADLVSALIPGDADERIKEKLRERLPQIIIDMQFVESVAGIEDVNEQLRIIFEKLKLSSDDAKNVFYHGLASLILEKLSDGNLSWSDAVAISEYYYREYEKKDLTN